MFLKQDTFNYGNQSVVLTELSGLQRVEYLAFVQKRTAEFDALDDAMPELDVLYMTRVQKERLDPSEYANVKAQFVLRASDLHNAKANMKVLHPLPRVDEIATDVDKTPHAWYFQQAGNGIFARQALLALVLNRDLVL